MDDGVLPPGGAWPVPLPVVLEALRVDDEVLLDLGPAGTLIVQWVPPQDAAREDRLPALGEQTLRVLRLVADGVPAAVAAETLALPLAVVADELTRLRARYRVESTAAAVQHARRAGDLD